MSETKVEGVPLTYDKRKKGHKFSWQGMEIFFKGKDTEEERKKIEVQVKELLGENKNETTSSFAEGGMEDGGLKDEGGTVDPVSGNEVPSGSTQSEVRDDIPAQLSEGEFVFPADVVRYIGLENLMELRAKAKQGLAKMEAMGQMGNSDEATMEDDGEYESEIDDLIDNFDPNDPESMEFSQGGVVYAQQGAYMQGQPQQQFSYGFMPPPQQGFQAPGYSVMPSQTPFITSPARVAVGQAPVAPENRTYVGPDGTEIIVPFYDGKPMKGYVIPKGFKYKSPEEVVAETPEIAQPVVAQPDSGGGSDDREREAEREAQMARDKEINNTLASYNKEFAEQWAQDPFNTGKMGIGGPMAAIYEGVQTHLGRTAAIEQIAKDYNIDLEEYKNTGIEGFFSKYDDERFARDLQAKMQDEQEEDMPFGFVSENTYVDSEGNVRDLSNVSAANKAAIKKGLDTYVEQVKQAQESGGDGGPVTTGGKGSTSFGYDPTQAEDYGDQSGSDQPSSGAGTSAGESRDDLGADLSSPFSKGGVVQQTERALKSSRKKK